MDAVALPGAMDRDDPVIADASALGPRYLGAWARSVIDGVEAGQVGSRQELQTLMEATSWLEWVQSPVFGLFQAKPTATPPPELVCS